MPEVMIAEGLINWNAKKVQGCIVLTKKQADFLISGTNAELEKHPETKKFYDGLDQAIRKDLGHIGFEKKKGVGSMQKKGKEIKNK